MVAPHELGPLEMQVLGLLGPSDAVPVSVLRDRLRANGHELAYTTVMTVLVRLHKKHLVQRKREGSRYLYSPARKAADVSTGSLTRVRRALFQSDRAAPIAALLEDESLSAEELRALRRMIDDKIKERK
ncbi:MAG: BlaI/MecI/CopY family transcriptional regulator [Polyangiales bacterium]